MCVCVCQFREKINQKEKKRLRIKKVFSNGHTSSNNRRQKRENFKNGHFTARGGEDIGEILNVMRDFTEEHAI